MNIITYKNGQRTDIANSNQNTFANKAKTFAGMVATVVICWAMLVLLFCL